MPYIRAGVCAVLITKEGFSKVMAYNMDKGNRISVAKYPDLRVSSIEEVEINQDPSAEIMEFYFEKIDPYGRYVFREM